MENEELEKYQDKINDFLEKKEISYQDREEIVLRMFLEYREYNKDSNEEEDLEESNDDDFDDFEDDESKEEEEDLEEQEQTAKQEKTKSIFKKPKIKPKAPPRVNGI